MKTGCLNWNELTATVATRPRAWRAASTLPAVSTCDMIQPPKMSPCWFASAGIGTTRRTGSLPSGSDIFLWSFMAGRLADFLRSRKRRGILDAERARRVARLVDAPHLEVGALEVANEARGVEQRVRVAVSCETPLQVEQLLGMQREVDRHGLVVLEGAGDERIETNRAEQARSDAGDEVLARKRDHGNPGPERVGRAGVRVARVRVEKKVGEPLPREVRRHVTARREHEPRRIDARDGSTRRERLRALANLLRSAPARANEGRRRRKWRSRCAAAEPAFPRRTARNPRARPRRRQSGSPQGYRRASPGSRGTTPGPAPGAGRGLRCGCRACSRSGPRGCRSRLRQFARRSVRWEARATRRNDRSPRRCPEKRRCRRRERGCSRRSRTARDRAARRSNG